MKKRQESRDQVLAYMEDAIFTAARQTTLSVEEVFCNLQEYPESLLALKNHTLSLRDISNLVWALGGNVQFQLAPIKEAEIAENKP